MLDSLLLYAGGLTALAGLFSRRWRVMAAGAGAMAIALAFPAWEKRIDRRASRLDDLVPIWQFHEKHEIDVALKTSFVLLADDAPREIVVGTRISRDTLAAMNFFVAPNGHGGSTIT